MNGYTDISELDDKAHHVRVTWNKMINYASTFAKEFLEIEDQFKSGRYGPEWTFARWLGVKCGMSHRTTYRMIQQIHRVASDDQRERQQRVIEQERRIRAQQEIDRRAGQIAWDQWLAEEKRRTSLTQTAWDQWLAEKKQRRSNVNTAYSQWLAEEKQRIKAEREAERLAKTKERKKKARRERNRRHRRLKKAENKRQLKEIEGETIFGAENAENAKPMPNVAQLEASLGAAIRAALSQLHEGDRLVLIERIRALLQQLSKFLNDPGDGPQTTGEALGHARLVA